jgi:glycerol-3-phosphate dehydrogenase
VGATNFLCNGNRVVGIEAEDVLTGDKLNIRGRVVLNAAGPWAEHLLKLQMGLRLKPELTYSRDAYIVTTRSISNDYALAVQARTKDPDAILSRGRRHLFLVPWRDCTLVGVWHRVHRGRPDEFTVTEEDIQGFLDEVNEAYPILQLTLQDVSMWSAGLILFGHNRPGATDLSYGKRSELVDHATADGVDGLVTLIGVRFTTSRGVAERAVDLVFGKLGKVPPKSRTATIPLAGGDIGSFDGFLRSAVAQRPAGVRAETMHALVLNHGSECGSVLSYIQRDPLWAEGLPGSTTIKAEVAYAVDEEKAQKLADVVFRRTDLGAGGYPGKPALRTCVDIMASKLGWNQERIKDELAEVEALFPSAALSDRGSHSGNRPGRAFSS